MTQSSGRIEFRPIRLEDRERLLAIASRIWEGHDYLPAVFDRWVDQPGNYFGGLELDGQIVGCGRVQRFDARRGWLEALRVDPDARLRGLGREMSRHVVQTALAMGLQELMFSTYFDNLASITISEQFGFRRIATFTHLELEKPSSRPASPPSPVAPRVGIVAGLPAVTGFVRNDWLFVPADAPDLARRFPNPRTVTGGGATLMLCDNTKYPGWLEIGWLNAPGGDVPGACIDAVLETARAEGRDGVHLMLPTGMRVAPFTERGFSFFEHEGDVYLYSARADELRI